MSGARRSRCRSIRPRRSPSGRSRPSPTCGRCRSRCGCLGNRDRHGAVRADLTDHVEGGLARIADRAVGDAHRIAVGAVAGALLGDDQDAPVAVEVRLAGRDRGREGRGGGSRQDREGGEGASGGLVEAGHCQSPVIWNFVIACVTHPCFGRMLRLFRGYRVLVILFRGRKEGGREAVIPGRRQKRVYARLRRAMARVRNPDTFDGTSPRTGQARGYGFRAPASPTPE